MSVSEREKYEQDVKDLHAGNSARHLDYKPVEFRGEAPAVSPAGEDKSKPVEVYAIGGKVFVNTHGEAVFDRDSLVTLRQHLDAAFQTVA